MDKFQKLLAYSLVVIAIALCLHTMWYIKAAEAEKVRAVTALLSSIQGDNILSQRANLMANILLSKGYTYKDACLYIYDSDMNVERFARK